MENKEENLKPPEVVRLNNTISIRTYKDTLFNYVDYFLSNNNLPDESRVYLSWIDNEFSNKISDFRISLSPTIRETWNYRKVSVGGLRKIASAISDCHPKTQFVLSFTMTSRTINVKAKEWRLKRLNGLTWA